MKCCSKSKFYELQPKHVIEVGAAGTHNVCVCERHQNMKLMLDAIHGKTEKYYLMNLIVCDVHYYECMLKRCVNCPGTNALLEYLMTTIPNDSIIKFKNGSQQIVLCCTTSNYLVMSLSHYCLPKSIN